MAEPMTQKLWDAITRHVTDINATYTDPRYATRNLRYIAALHAEVKRLRSYILDAARALDVDNEGDARSELHSALGIEYDDDPHEVPDVA